MVACRSRIYVTSDYSTLVDNNPQKLIRIYAKRQSVRAIDILRMHAEYRLVAWTLRVAVVIET